MKFIPFAQAQNFNGFKGADILVNIILIPSLFEEIRISRRKLIFVNFEYLMAVFSIIAIIMHTDVGFHYLLIPATYALFINVVKKLRGSYYPPEQI